MRGKEIITLQHCSSLFFSVSHCTPIRNYIKVSLNALGGGYFWYIGFGSRCIYMPHPALTICADALWSPRPPSNLYGSGSDVLETQEVVRNVSCASARVQPGSLVRRLCLFLCRVRPVSARFSSPESRSCREALSPTCTTRTKVRSGWGRGSERANLSRMETVLWRLAGVKTWEFQFSV